MVATYFLYSCSSSGSESSLKDELAGASGKTEAKKTGSNKCLLGYADKLDELFTKPEAVEVSGLDGEKADFKYTKIMTDPFYHYAMFSWDGSRVKKIKVGNMEIDAPVSDQITLYGIRAMSEEEFKRNRRNVTDEELAQMNQQIEKALSGDTENKAIKERLDKLEKMGVDKKTVVGTGSAIGGMAGRVAQAYKEVPGLGDVAAWNTVEKRLYVLSGGVEFSVAVDLGDESTDQTKAVTLAKKILAKCK